MAAYADSCANAITSVSVDPTRCHRHTNDLVSLDFFTLPTATFRVLFVFIVLRHDRRRIVHFNVTEHPSAEWTAGVHFGDGEHVTLEEPGLCQSITITVEEG